MKLGKRHPSEVAKSLPGWERKFMSYKALKKQVKLINPHCNGKKGSRSGDRKLSEGGSNAGNSPAQGTGSLDRELNKINTYYIDKQEDYVIRFRVILSDLPLSRINRNFLKKT